MFKIPTFLAIFGVYITLELAIAKFISRLVPAILVRAFLDSIVCQMYYFIVKTIKIKFPTTSPQVSILAPISSRYAINFSEHEKVPYIKFPTIVEQRSGKIVLYNEGFT